MYSGSPKAGVQGNVYQLPPRQTNYFISCGKSPHRWNNSRTLLVPPEEQKVNTQEPSLGTDLHRRDQAVHVIAPVTIITEQQLVVILTGPTQGAGLALDALPGVLLDTNHHVVSKLQTCRVA